MPESTREQRLQPILHTYLQAVDRGEKPDRQAILDTHPDLRDELAAYSADASKLEGMAKSLKTASFSPANRAQPTFKVPTLAELADKFPQFEIVELLGQGGMGAVYKARQKGLDRLFALKILPPDAGRDASFADRFMRDAKALAKLSHPNIVGVHDVGQTADGLCYFVMEFIDGVNLRQTTRAGKVFRTGTPLLFSADESTRKGSDRNHQVSNLAEVDWRAQEMYGEYAGQSQAVAGLVDPYIGFASHSSWANIGDVALQLPRRRCVLRSAERRAQADFRCVLPSDIRPTFRRTSASRPISEGSGSPNDPNVPAPLACQESVKNPMETWGFRRLQRLDRHAGRDISHC